MSIQRSSNIYNTLVRALCVLSVSVPFVVSAPHSAAIANSLMSSSASTLMAQMQSPINRAGCLEAYIAGHSIDVPALIDTRSGCYELRLDGRTVRLEKGRTLAQAIAALESSRRAHPNAWIDGYYSGFKIGYELYWNGQRVGYEPGWSLQQAIANLEWNKAAYPDTKVEGYFYGFKVGYELYWNGARVGYEPGWTYEQAIANLQWNQQTYPDRVVTAFYNGTALP